LPIEDASVKEELRSAGQSAGMAIEEKQTVSVEIRADPVLTELYVGR